MALKLTDVPPLLSMREAFAFQKKYDPYLQVGRLFERAESKTLTALLRGVGKTRMIASIPTALIHSSNKKITELYAKFLEQGVGREFFYCASIARSLARKYHDDLPSFLEDFANAYDSKCCALSHIPFEEFKHIYDVYRHANRLSCE